MLDSPSCAALSAFSEMGFCVGLQCFFERGAGGGGGGEGMWVGRVLG